MGRKQGMFRYKVFRQKLLLLSAVILLMILLLLYLSYAFFSTQWVNEFRNNTAAIHQTVGSRLQAGESLLDMQVSRLYASRELIADLKVLMKSPAEKDYLEGRRRNSLASRIQIRSVPEELRTYLMRHGLYFSQVSLRSSNAVTILTEGERGLEVRHLSPEPDPLEQPASGYIAVRRSVYNPYDVTTPYSNMGEIAIWYNIRELFPDFSGDDFLFLAMQSDEDTHYLVGDSEQNSLLQEIEMLPAASGNFRNGLGQVYYVTYEFPHYSGRLIACVDDWTLIRAGSGILIPITLIILAVGAFFLFLTFSNVRYDARFLDRILGTIGAVKKGDFSGVPVPEEGRYRSNEYGMIARELDDMSRKLQRHIEAEYQFRLKQQEAEMRALQHQINPHFLYNTLEIIRSRALVANHTGTADIIAILGSLYRDIVKQQDVITLGDELLLLEKYLKIMHFKDPENFLYQIETEDKELLAIPTVKFWMQPLAENFFTHGYDRESPYNLLLVNLATNGDCCRVSILDNGSGIPPERVEELNSTVLSSADSAENKVGVHGIGLGNVYTRLKFFYGDSLHMCIENNPEGGIRILADIPKQVESD